MVSSLDPSRAEVGVLATVIQIEAWSFLAAVALIVLLRLASGSIDIAQAQLSRMQFLFASIGFAAYYLSLVTANPAAPALPDPGTPAMMAFGGSSAFYLANKLVGLWPAIMRS